ncbi:MAG: hypothetical protein HWE20_14710 [Gammaproteobacteria bacterium]|nr:hypothetical protein [Gammaproteobacteria bacterium]
MNCQHCQTPLAIPEKDLKQLSEWRHPRLYCIECYRANQLTPKKRRRVRAA